jgi:hypothetical protein
MKKIALVCVLLMLAGCASKPERLAESSNAEIKVSVLTKFEGITLYRVEVDGKQIYVARSGSSPVNVEAHWTDTVCNPCGKGQTCCRQVPRSQATLGVAAR